MITDEYLIKNGNKISKLRLIYTDHPDEPNLCDGCDEMKQCAHIDTVTKQAFPLCKDCLNEIIESF